MSKLNIEQNIAAPDELYQKLIDMHEGLDDKKCMKLSVKLILLLANHIGDADVIDEAISNAKDVNAEQH